MGELKDLTTALSAQDVAAADEFFREAARARLAEAQGPSTVLELARVPPGDTIGIRLEALARCMQNAAEQLGGLRSVATPARWGDYYQLYKQNVERLSAALKKTVDPILQPSDIHGLPRCIDLSIRVMGDRVTQERHMRRLLHVVLIQLSRRGAIAGDGTLTPGVSVSTKNPRVRVTAETFSGKFGDE